MPAPLPSWPDALRARSLRIWSGGVLGLFVLGHLSTLDPALVSAIRGWIYAGLAVPLAAARAARRWPGRTGRVRVTYPDGRTVSVPRGSTVLFCDLRGFTRRAERWLPFDTVFLLNRYVQAVGEAVEVSGGHVDKFIGDGARALFGLGCPPEEACRQALAAAAAAAVTRGRAALNAEFAAELGEPLRIAMGIHAGPAVVGDMGFGGAVSLTAVGDGVRSVAVRGRVAPVDAVLVAHASALSPALEGLSVPPP